MKRFFTHSLSVWLSICMLLASAGVPVFAHSCNMNSECEEISVLPPQSCCPGDEKPAETTDESCLEADACCKNEVTVAKAELPAFETFANHISIVPQPAMFAVPHFLLFKWAEAETHLNTPVHPSPPNLSGRQLLTDIQVFRI